VSQYTHLAYATTAYGVQGATVPESHTVLSDALDAAGVYVGMTRGQNANRLHIVAADLDDAREQFTAALERDRADRGLEIATQAAQDAVVGLTADGPVRVVNTERARLTVQIEHASQQADKWGRAVAVLARQADAHKAESDEQETIVKAAEAIAERVRADVVAPLVEQATADGTAHLAARSRVWEASEAQRAARGLRKRRTAHAVTAASDEHRTIETAGRRRWGGLPETLAGVEPWATSVAQQQADADPRVTEARKRADDARQAHQRLTTRQAQERADLRHRVFGNHTPNSAQTHAARWREQAEVAHRDLAAIEALPPVEASRLIRARADRQARAARLHDFTHRQPGRGQTAPDRGLGR
jgi:hypothetical protein